MLVGCRAWEDLRKLFEELLLEQWDEQAHFGIGEVVFAFGLHLAQVAYEQLFVQLVLPSLEKVVAQFSQHFYTPHSNLAQCFTAEFSAHDFFLLADDVVVVEHPLVGAAHEVPFLRFFYQEQIVICDFFDAFLKTLVHLFHMVE